MTATIRVLTTGGTIASTRTGDGTATPDRSGEALVEAVPDLDAYADVTLEEIASKPSFDLDFAILFDLRDAIDPAAEDSERKSDDLRGHGEIRSTRPIRS